jgi:hypothetical protein
MNFGAFVAVFKKKTSLYNNIDDNKYKKLLNNNLAASFI